jgi:DNA-binding GntR family transcriptional regulator
VVALAARSQWARQTIEGKETMDIIKATKRSARASATMAKHARAISDARRNGDANAAARAIRLHARAKTTYEKARAAALFPWERKTI